MPIDAVQNAVGLGSGDARAEAEATLNAAMAEYDNISLPELQKLILENPNWLKDLKASTIDGGGDVTFDGARQERAALDTVDGTAFDNVATDPRLKEQQTASLAALKELADGGGFNSTDQANLARSRSGVEQADRGRREAIQQGMARRGMGGSGMDLLAQLDSSQAATDRQSQEGLNIAGMAQDRALQALMQGGSLAGDVRGQDFSEQSRVAEARDSIAKFNSANTNQNNLFNAGAATDLSKFNTDGSLKTDMYNRDTNIDTQKFNAGQTQSADQFNISGQQTTHNTGVANNNAATTSNAGQAQQQFDNSITKADGKARLAGEMAGLHAAEAARKDEQFGQVVAGGAMVASGGASKSDERSKKDVKATKDIDLDTFLATIQSKKYKYKDPKDGEGERTGIMAQDLLKSKLGQEAVVQTEDGMLGYDKDKMQGIMLAAIKHLSDKIDKKG